ncbi:MAG: glycosyltransferase [Methylococcales bacterium]|nr:glycosyltransferase [Methylococcales bacterium]
MSAPPVFFLARSLHIGGAERQLLALAIGLKQQGHAVSVVVFYAGGEFEAELVAAGISLISLNKTGRWDIVPFLSRLVRVHRKAQPQLLHSYLTVPNLLSVLLKPWLPNTRIVWGVRASNMDLSRYDWLSRLTYRFECLASRYADLVIANSNAGKQYAVANGFRSDTITVVPNGIDTQRFHFNAQGRQHLRAQWGLADNEVLVGLVGRLDAMKDHGNFIAAGRLVLNAHPNVRLVCIGSGASDYGLSLQKQSEDLGERLIWAGPCHDMAAAYSALDISVSSSLSEGFSNTIAEAMACGRPCVATDVGDSAWIIGDTGVLVPAANPTLLADGLLQLLELDKASLAELGKQAHLRVEQEFSLDKLLMRTESALGLV